MPEDETHFLGLHHKIDWNHNRAQPHERIAQDDEAVRVAREHRDPVAALNSPRGERSGEPLRQIVKLTVSPSHRVARDAQFVGNPTRYALACRKGSGRPRSAAETCRSTRR
jgi:hypothetical protein